MDTRKPMLHPFQCSRAYNLSVSEELPGFDITIGNFSYRDVTVSFGNLYLSGRILTTKSSQVTREIYQSFEEIKKGLSKDLEIEGLKSMNKTRNIPSAKEVLTPNTDKALDLIAEAISLISAERQGEKISVSPATEIYIISRSSEYSFEVCFQNNKENEMCVKHMNFDTVNKVLYDKGWKVEPSKYVPDQRDNPCTIKLILRADI